MGWNHLPCLLFDVSKQKRSCLLLFPTAAVLSLYKIFTCLLCYKCVCAVTSERRAEGSARAWVGRGKGSSRRVSVTLGAFRTKPWKGSGKVIFPPLQYNILKSMLKGRNPSGTFRSCCVALPSTEQQLLEDGVQPRRAVAGWARTLRVSFHFCLTGWVLLHIILFPWPLGSAKTVAPKLWSLTVNSEVIWKGCFLLHPSEVMLQRSLLSLTSALSSSLHLYY